MSISMIRARIIAIPRSAFNAVFTPGSDRPSSTRVIATAGRMPTTAQAQAYRRLIDGLTDAQVESVASLEDLLRLTARR